MARVLFLSLVLAWPALASAGEAVDFQVLHKVLAGSRDRPALTVTATDAVESVEIKLVREDGKVTQFKTGRLKAGQSKRFPFDVPAGRAWRFKATMTTKVDGPTESADFEFESEIVTPATVTVDKSKLDLQARTLEAVSTRPTERVEVVVTSDEGVEVGRTEVAFESAPAGTPLPVRWNQAEGTKAMKIAVRAYDPDDFSGGIELFPWRIDIPHEEVNFATNSSDIDRAEETKLASSLALVQEAVAKYGRFADVKLFVGGHTDTVGDPASNRTLSLNRARAISTWFRRHGLRIPVFFDGFGEDALEVPTADNVDEVKNRRAEYIVAIEPPPIHGGGAAWKPLK